VKYKKQYLLLILLPLLMLVSCKDDSIDFIKDIIPSSDKISVKTDTFHLDAKTDIIVHIPMKNTASTFLLGTNVDPVFGKTTGEILAQFNCPINWTLPADTISTQLILYVTYTGYNATNGDNITINAYRMDGQVLDIPSPVAQTYYSDIDTATYSSKHILLGSATFPIARNTKGDSVVTYPINLNLTNLKNELIDSTHYYDNATDFTHHFKGIYLTAQSTNSSILNVSQLQMELLYSYRSVGGTILEGTKNFLASKEVRQVNYIHHDYTSVTPADSVVQVNSPAGENAIISIPLKRMKDRLGVTSQNGIAFLGTKKLSVNNCMLNVEVTDSAKSLLTLPKYILLIKKSQVDDFFKNSRSIDGKTSIIGTYTYSSTGHSSYSFDLKYYLANEFKSPSMSDVDDLELIAVTGILDTNGNVVKADYDLGLQGVSLLTKQSSSPLKLNVLVSGF